MLLVALAVRAAEERNCGLTSGQWPVTDSAAMPLQEGLGVGPVDRIYTRRTNKKQVYVLRKLAVVNAGVG